MIKLHSVEGGFIPSFEEIKVFGPDAGKLGQAYILGTDYYTVADDTGKIAFVGVTGVYNSNKVQAIRVTDNILFEAEKGKYPDDVTMGAKLAVDVSGLGFRTAENSQIQITDIRPDKIIFKFI